MPSFALKAAKHGSVAVVTKPFDFEGKKRKMQAEEGLRLLRASVDTLITIPNQRLLQVVERGTSLRDAFRVADNVLRQAVQGISDLITTPGLINLDTSIQRVWSFKERFQLKFRADMFNVANTPHHAIPNGAVNNGAFMQALGIANTGRDGVDQRQFRFGIRLGF